MRDTWAVPAVGAWVGLVPIQRWYSPLFFRLIGTGISFANGHTEAPAGQAASGCCMLGLVGWCSWWRGRVRLRPPLRGGPG